VPIKLDFSKTQDQTFDLIEAGRYPAKVDTAEEKGPGASGFNYLSVKFKIQDGPAANRNVWANYSFSPQSLWSLKQLLIRLGTHTAEALAKKIDLDPRELIGKDCVLVLSGKASDAEGNFNEVTDVLEAGASLEEGASAGGSRGW